MNSKIIISVITVISIVGGYLLLFGYSNQGSYDFGAGDIKIDMELERNN